MLTLYKYITAALAFAGTMSLIITGELNPVFVLPGVMLIPGYYRYVTGRPPVSRWLIAALAMAEVLVLGFDIFMVSDDFLIAIAHMTIVFQALKSFDMREPWDPLQVYFMSILQMVITSELSLSILVGVAYAVFMLIFMAAMVFSHFIKEGTIETVRFKKPIVSISMAALVLTLIFFIAIPRLSSGLWGRKASGGLRSVGFSGTVDLGTYGQVLEDDSIVMRAELIGAPLPLYWRGIVLDHFDGHRWRDTDYDKVGLKRRGGRFTLNPITDIDKSLLTTQKIIIEPIDTNVLFGLGEVRVIEAKGWFFKTDLAGAAYLIGKENRRLSYTVISLADTGNRRVFSHDRHKHLQMPSGLESVVELAHDVTAGFGTDLEKVNAIMQYLKSNYKYTLSPRPGGSRSSPLEWFLFGSREGYCEHFSTAMAIMLRAEGIPSRIVTGFMGGDANLFGNYVIVRQRNAHSWVDVGIKGRWVRFDPTPVSAPRVASGLLMALDSLRMKWYRYVIGFSSYDQSAMLSSLTSPVFETPDMRGIKFSVAPLYLIAVFIMTGFLLWMLLRGRTGVKRSEATRAYMRFRRSVARRGGDVRASSTPEDVAREALRLKADPGAVAILMDLYLAVRFGHRELNPQERARLKKLSSGAF